MKFIFLDFKIVLKSLNLVIMSHSKKYFFNYLKKFKNIKFDLYLDIQMKIILYDWIDHLNFKNKK